MIKIIMIYIIREIIYQVVLENKELIKPFLLSGMPDNILENSKLVNYLDKIKNDGFYDSIIEISLANIIFNYTIIYILMKKILNFRI